MKYYIIERENIGPNKDDYLDEHTISIDTSPAVTNMSNEPRIKGWCGTTNDWSVNAHGEYDTIEAAREAVHKMFDVRDDEAFVLDDDTVARYIIGSKPIMSATETMDYYYEDIRKVTSETTDEQIDTMIAGFKADKFLEWEPNWSALRDTMIDIRDQLAEGASEDN